MKTSQIERIGIAVKSIDDVLPFCKNVLGIHQIAHKVEDGFIEGISEIRSKKLRMIDYQPRIGTENLNIVFIKTYSSKEVLTELCEE